MAEKLLTDRQCKAAKASESVYYKSDGKGLRLQVRPDGAKYWMLRYLISGKESTAGLGRYPSIGLEEARQKATEARLLIAGGIRPAVDRRVTVARNVARSEATFEAVADEWLERNKSHWSAHHYERNSGLVRRILLPDLGKLPIHEITEPVLLGVLRDTYDSGIKESARRARGVAAQIFGYAKDTHRATHNPARELAGNQVLKKPEVKHFEAIKASQVGPMLQKLEKFDLDPVTRAALLLMLYTGLRDYSLRAARWSEIDLEGGVWTVPGERMKSGREHRLPLPVQAVAILKQLAEQTREDPASFVFRSHGKLGHLAENTLRLALHRMGFKVTAHGFRSLITDLLNESGFNSDAIERQLDHQSKDKVRAAYLRSEWLDYRRTMMQWLADWMDAQCKEKRIPELPDNVIAFRKEARSN
jgi:integrase